MYQQSPASAFVRAAGKKDFCLAALMSTFDGTTAEVIAIKFGEQGYYQTDYGRQTREWVAEQNERLGVDPASAAAYEFCSLFNRWEGFETIRSSMMGLLNDKKAEASHV